MTRDDDKLAPDGWTPEDDERIRAAMTTLRDDVDRVVLSDPAEIRSRYAPRTRRRTLGWLLAAAAAIIAAAGIAFSQLGNPWAAETPELVPGGTTTTATDSPTEATTEPTQGPSTEPAQEPTDSAPEPGATIPPCDAVVGEVNTDVAGITAEQVATAEQLMELALACDQDALVDRVIADETNLSFGNPQPQDVFVIPPDDDDRYGLLTRLLTVPPQLDAESGIVQWPTTPQSDADWQALVDAGILSQSDMELIRDNPDGYLGWRLGIAADGTWYYFVGGD